MSLSLKILLHGKLLCTRRARKSNRIRQYYIHCMVGINFASPKLLCRDVFEINKPQALTGLTEIILRFVMCPDRFLISNVIGQSTIIILSPNIFPGVQKFSRFESNFYSAVELSFTAFLSRLVYINCMNISFLCFLRPLHFS